MEDHVACIQTYRMLDIVHDTDMSVSQDWMNSHRAVHWASLPSQIVDLPSKHATRDKGCCQCTDCGGGGFGGISAFG